MFSEMVDSVMNKAGRPDQRANTVDYVNSTIRECQTLQMFYRDLVEGILPINNTQSVVNWDMPRDLNKLKTIRYPDGSFPPMIQPGKRQQDKLAYYYAAGSYYVFVGVDSLYSFGAPSIKYAYYKYLPRLVYFTTATRPAVFNQATQQWSYLDTNITDDTSEEALRAQAQVSNWLLDRYPDAISEGALAKLFKTTGSPERSVTSYSLYKQMQQAIVNSEAFEAQYNGEQ